MRCASSPRGRMVKEAAILSTCNRTEVYFHGGTPEPVDALARNARATCRRRRWRRTSTRWTRDRAVSHAFRVASGLDSMVLGEPQILGQMKQAVRAADAAGSLGLVLNRLFQRTFAVAKDVRTQHRHRQRVDLDGGCGGQARGAHLPVAVRPAPAADRRGRDDRARRDAFRGRNAALDHRRQPHARARPVSSRTRFGADAITLTESERAARAVRRHRHVHGEHAADHRQGHARARRQAAPACAGADRRSRRAARRRARGGDARRRVPLQRRRPVRDRQGQPADPPRCGRAGRADDRRPDGALPALAARPQRRADDRRAVVAPRCAAQRASSSARSGCSPPARRRQTCSTRSRAA